MVNVIQKQKILLLGIDLPVNKLRAPRMGNGIIFGMDDQGRSSNLGQLFFGVMLDKIFEFVNAFGGQTDVTAGIFIIYEVIFFDIPFGVMF